MSNNQIAFDKSFAHLAKQGRKSLGTNGSCMFRGELECQCALGPLISDSDALTLDGREGGTFAQVQGAVDRHMRGHVNTDLVSALQSCHDDEEVHEWPDAARRLAKEFELSTDGIEALDWSACEASS